MKQNHIIFRCDGGFKIGLGHIVGSLRLAKILKKELSIIPVFLIKENEKIIDYLKANRIQYSVIPLESSVDSQINIIKKLSEDNKTRTVSFNLHADELKLWGDRFSHLKEQGFNIIFQDNPMQSFLFGDIVINALPHPKYPGYELNKHKSCFDGLEYLLLDETILKYQNRKRKNEGTVEQILIAPGGSDHKNITSLLLKILADIQCNAYIDVVLGPVSEHIAEIEKLIKGLSLNAHLSYNVLNMPERIWNADIGFSTLGLTTYEMAALNLPCFIIAPNKLNAESARIYVKKYSMAMFGGLIDELSFQKLKSNVISFINDQPLHNRIRNQSVLLKGPVSYNEIIFKIEQLLK